MPDLVPGTLVLRFFLAPDDVGGIVIACDDLGIAIDGKRVKLLNPDDNNRIKFILFALGQKIVVNLATAKDHSINLQRIIDSLAINHGPEGTIGQIFY